MEPNFSSDFFIANRQRLRTLFKGTAPIVITANGLLQKSNDTVFPFKQDTSFWYLTGINEPDIILVMDKDREYLIVPEREHVKEVFDGSVDFHSLTAVSGINEVVGAKNGWKKIGSRLTRAKHVATLAAPPAYIGVLGMYTNPARSQLFQKIIEVNSTIELLDLRQHLAVMRMVKQPAELAAIRESVNLTVKSLKKVAKSLTTYTYEYEIDGELTASFRRQGAQHGYQPIIAAGKNACILHYTLNTDALAPKDLVLIDVGAELHGYSADITRTYALTKPSRRQQAVYDAVLAVQQFAMKQLKPGVLIKEYEKTIELFMGEKLRALGLIKNIDHDSVRQFYPHATSHFLGLDVHDVADYDRPLEAGNVLTVEPGIYIPSERIGIRIEDNVVVTQSGIEVLSAALPRALA